MTGFRNNSNRSGTVPAHDWANYPACLEAFTRRFQGVVVENKDALDLIRQLDGAETLFYVDPPYLPETRDRGVDYAHELTEQQHHDLAHVLRNVSGMVVLSGYPSVLYDNLYSGWHKVSRVSLSDGAKTRTEVLWVNGNAWIRRLNKQLDMFTEVSE